MECQSHHGFMSIRAHHFSYADFERSRFAADAITCPKQAASEIRDQGVLQHGLFRVTMRQS